MNKLTLNITLIQNQKRIRIQRTIYAQDPDALWLIGKALERSRTWKNEPSFKVK